MTESVWWKSLNIHICRKEEHKSFFFTYDSLIKQGNPPTNTCLSL
jgi:hypothetical protein